MRHGIAAERVDGCDHPDRALTAVGQTRTDAVMKALVSRGVRVDRLISSPYRRALETARLAQQAGLAPFLDLDERLKPGGSVESLVPSLVGNICLVGHEPDLGDLAAALLGLCSGVIVLKKAGLVHLRQSGQTWELRALLRPALLFDQQDAENSSA
ncbi:MAG: phosphohistidine phosphatase [Cyanobium sp. NAT70]|nr:phosphohistidine phosphatase [Cyanobium sp. NAT70]